MARISKSLDIDYTVCGSLYSDILGGVYTPYSESANDMMNDMISLGAAPAEAPVESSYCTMQ